MCFATEGGQPPVDDEGEATTAQAAAEREPEWRWVGSWPEHAGEGRSA